MRIAAFVLWSAASWLGSFSQSELEQEDGLELQSYNVSALEQVMRVRDAIPRLDGVWSDLYAQRLGFLEDDIEASNLAFGDPDRTRFDSLDWEDFLRSSLRAQANDPDGDEGFEEVESAAGLLSVSADPSSHERIARILDSLTEQQRRTIEAVVFQFSGATRIEAPIDGKLEPAEIESLLRTHSPLRTYRATIYPAQIVELGIREKRDILWEYEIDDAVEGIEFSPTVGEALCGTQIYVDATRAVRGGTVLRVRGRHVTEWSKREITVELEGFPKRKMELPKARVERFLVDSVVDEGGGILVGSHTTTGSWWLIQVKSTQPEVEPSPFVRAGGLTARRTRWSSLYYPGALAGGGGEWPRYGAAEDLLPILDRPRMTPGELTSVLFQQVKGLEDIPPVWFGTELYVPSASTREAIREVLLDESKTVERPLAFELRFDEVSAEEAEILRVLPAAELAQHLGQSARGSVRLGSFASVRNEIEHGYSHERQSSSGNSAGPSEPSMASLHDGFQLGLHALPTRRGTIYVCTQFCLQRILDLTRSLPVTVPRIPWNAEDRMKLELPVTTGVRFTPPLETNPGEWKILGNSPLDGTERIVFAVLRLTE